MPHRPRIGSRNGSHPEIDVASWAPVDVDALSDQRRAQFLRRRQAITLYLDGATAGELKEATGLARSNVYRIISERCLATHSDGTMMGWRGALPFLRVQVYRRKTKPRANEQTGGGAVGALQWLFASPGGAELEARFRKHIVGKVPKLASARRPKQELFIWFIKELRAAGLEARGEWPLNVEKMGYVTISKFIDKVMVENPRRQRQMLGGEEAERKARSGDGVERPPMRVYQRVECDAHKLDSRMVVLVPSPHGGYEARKIHRLWVIVIIEVVSRAVLGYHLSLRLECSAEDVLRAVKKSLSRWIPRELQWSRSAYGEGAALPSGHHERYVGACWDEFSVDGAMANICARVERQLREVVGSTVLKPQDPASYTSRRSKDDRPYIESFFRQLTKGGFHRLSTTTGSKPEEKRGSDPDQATLTTQFQLEYAEELLDTLIVNYNAVPHSGLGWRSPLAQLDFLVGREPERLRRADADDVRRMVNIRRQCTLKGGVSTGRRPHFNFANGRYSAEWLVLRTDLIGKLLWLQLDSEDDARFASVSTQQGEFLGVVRAAPPWHLSPHTLYVREAIRALERRRLLHLTGQCDAVEELIRFAEGSAGKKLPPHPAYFEARRVLRQHVEDSAGQPMLNGGSASTPPTAATTAGPATTLQLPATVPEKPRRRLPAMRMAKTW